MYVALEPDITSGGVASIGGKGGGTIPVQSDVEEFNRLLGGVDQMMSSSAPLSIQAASKPLEATAIDTIKNGLQGASDMYSERMSRLDKIAKAANKSNSMGDMLSFQLESVKMGVELEFTGKVVAKAAQDVEQLTRQQ